MQVILIVAPVFALIAIGYLASLTRLLSEAAHKGISEFTFCIAMPALLFRTIALTDIPAVEPLRLWAAYFGAVAIVWIIATALTSLVLHRPAADAPAIAMGAVYGNIVMLGIPLALALYGSEAAAPMALILSINTPLLWMCATLHMAVTEHNAGASVPRLLLSVVADLGRNPVILAIVAGSLWHLGGFSLHPLADKVLALLGQSGVPCALVALGAGLTQFQIKGQAPTLSTMLVLKLVALPAIAWVLAFYVLDLPPVAAAVVVLFAAMPTGANAYLFATRYQRVLNSTSGAVALGTILAAATASALVALLVGTGAR
jgi:malonate transporter and related proteins